MIDWRTEEDEQVWEQPAAPDVPVKTAVWRRWWLWVGLLLLLVAGAVPVVAQLNQRVAQRMDGVRQDVRQARALQETAVATDDIDLFSLLLPTNNAEWRALQRLLFREKLVVDRAPLNLWRQTAVADVPSAVQVSPDFTRAEMITLEPYLALTADGQWEAVTLRQTAVFQERNGRWLRQSTDNDTSFWGKTLVNRSGVYLELVYPERDKEVARRLALDLDGLLGQLCADDRFACPADAVYRLRLSPDTAALYRLTDNIRTLNMRRYGVPDHLFYELVLPTPTLVGYPMDEGSYAALLRGYGGWLTAVAMKNLGAPGVSHADVVAKLDALQLPLPPVAGYNPLVAGVTAPPPAPVVLTCVDGERPSQTWLYTPDTDSWQPTDVTVTQAEPSPPSVARVPPTVALLAAVPRSERPLHLLIVAALSQGDQQVLLAEAGAQRPELFVFQVMGDAVAYVGQVTRLGDVPQTAQLGGNGRFLLLVGYDYRRSFLTLYDLATTDSTLYTLDGQANGRFDWSADGNWLLLVADRSLRLVNAAQGSEQLVYHNVGGCINGRWLDD